MSKFVIFLVTAVSLVGCGQQGDDRLIEKARIEGREQSRAELDTIAEKAREMEQDLALRHQFYQTVRGTYEGWFTSERGEFRVRVRLVPSLPPYPVTRVRSLDEIAADLSGLHFIAQVQQWSPANPLSAVGCRIERIRPDLLSGEIMLASEACPNLYALRLDDPATRTSETGREGPIDFGRISRRLAREVMQGARPSVPAISGTIQPTSNASQYSFTAQRTEN